MTRKQRITYLEIKLQNPDLTLSSRIRDEATLRDLKYIDELEDRYKSLQGAYQRLAEKGLEYGRKFCYRYCHEVVEQCEMCESCPDGWGIAWDEGEEQ